VEEVKDGDKVVTAAVPEVAIFYGQFIQDFISFLILAMVVFIVIKKVVLGMQKEKEKAPPAPPKQEVLLEEIRDLLKKNA
ncbi:MAG: MscL family protein, partial [Verrucomicrobiales bacterium]